MAQPTPDEASRDILDYLHWRTALKRREDNGRRIGVVHSMHVWLSQTMVWLYTQVKYMPPRIENHVVCDRTLNLDQFPFENLVSADADSWLWRAVGSKSWPVAKWRRTKQLLDRARDCRAEILHSHFGDRGWANIEIARRTGLTHVVSFYGYDVGHLPKVEPVWHDRYQEMFRTADLFLCEGPHLGKCLVALGCPAEKVKVQHLSVNLEQIPFQPRRWRPGEPLRVLIAGSFIEKKGMPYAIEALSRIKGRADLEVTMIGDARNQERSRQEKARILDTIARTGLESQVRFLGYQTYSALMAEAYRNHLFLAPSVTASDGDTEGGAPVSVIEMAASGMPVVSTRHCDIPEILEDEVTGLLAEERDVDGLETRLLWLLDHPDRWEEMVTAARRHVEAEFSAIIQGERLAGLYESLLADSGSLRRASA